MIKELRTMRRKIPIFRVVLQQGASYSQLTEIPAIRKAVMHEAVYAIKEGIKKKKITISLFDVANSQYYINLDRPNWKKALNNAMNYFVELEDYTMCSQCRDLIKELD